MSLVRVLFAAILTAISVFAVCLALALRLIHYAEPAHASSLPIAPSLFSTSDTITIWLGLLGVMIALASLVVTGVGLVVGALAIFGYQTFRDEFTRRVGEESNQYFGGSSFKKTLESSVKKHIQSKSVDSETVQDSVAAPEIRLRQYPKKLSPKP